MVLSEDHLNLSFSPLASNFRIVFISLLKTGIPGLRKKKGEIDRVYEKSPPPYSRTAEPVTISIPDGKDCEEVVQAENAPLIFFPI